MSQRMKTHNDEKAGYQLFKQAILEEVGAMHTKSIEKNELLKELQSKVETLKSENQVI